MKIPLKPILKWVGKAIAAAAVEAAADRLTRPPRDRRAITEDTEN